ncbi:MAG: response regulator [Candidatus Schekmanbacteria bacterium]|nr:response regulator [Candidatus Schekmanbacteria bacterium]
MIGGGVTSTDYAEDDVMQVIDRAIRAAADSFGANGAALLRLPALAGPPPIVQSSGLLSTIDLTPVAAKEHDVFHRIARSQRAEVGTLAVLFPEAVARNREWSAGSHCNDEVLAMPVRLAEAGGAAVLLIMRSCGEPFAHVDIAHAKGLAGVLGSALDLALRAHHQAHVLQCTRTIKLIGEQAASALTIEQLLDCVIEAASSLFRTDACGIYLLRSKVSPEAPDSPNADDLFDLQSTPVGSPPAGDLSLRCLLNRDLPVELAELLEQGYPHLPVFSRITAGLPTVVTDLYGGVDARLVHVLRDSELRTIVILPLRHGQEIFGAVAFFFRQDLAVTSRELEVAQAFANAVSLSISNMSAMTRARRMADHVAGLVSRLEVAQQHLMHSEKMMAIGRMIAGIAHELNNPLTAILGFSHLLRESKDRRDTTEKCVTRIAQEAERCQKIVQSLLTFARLRPPDRVSLDLNEVIRSAVELRRYELRRSGIELHQELGELPALVGDFHQLQQVVFNLLVNAEHAMRAAAGTGHLWLRSRSEEEEGKTVVVVEVEDNGQGIDETALPHVFEPFFTTKPVGEGTGLGLSVSYGIVREHLGTIVASNVPGGGARFAVRVPVAQRPAAPALSEDNEGQPQASGGHQRILVIDDEDAIGVVLRDMLTLYGYDVEIAETPHDGLRRALEGAFELIICDLMMPGLSGKDLYDEVMRLRPQVGSRFLFMTGDVVASRNQETLRALGRPFVLKPFKIRELMATVRSFLGARATS